jgi:hypothetical protein
VFYSECHKGSDQADAEEVTLIFDPPLRITDPLTLSREWNSNVDSSLLYD